MNAPLVCRSHPSFNQQGDGDEHPARDKLQELLDSGFGRLYASREEAERTIGGPCYPAPLGDVIKYGA